MRRQRRIGAEGQSLRALFYALNLQFLVFADSQRYSVFVKVPLKLLRASVFGWGGEEEETVQIPQIDLELWPAVLVLGLGLVLAGPEKTYFWLYVLCSNNLSNKKVQRTDSEF